MKTLISLFLLASAPAFAANVNVVVDGQAYNCTPGAATGGCSCKTFKDGSYYYFRVNYDGDEVFRSGAYYNALESISACKAKVNELSACK